MGEFFENILNLSYWEIMSDLHGGLAMMSLVLFGAVIILLKSVDKFARATVWLKNSLLGLLASLATLDFMGLFIYRAYRDAGPTSPRSILKSSEDTAWLHSTVFEHKEFLALVPVVLILVATIIVFKQNKSFKNSARLRKIVLFAVLTALFYVLVVAAEAVLVTKAAPLG